jgi:hypothetical protein
MKEMVSIIPLGLCPNCGHGQFVVIESTMSTYLTNNDGEIIDSKEICNEAIGRCVRCGREYNMLSTLYGFIPLSNLRSILFNNTPHINKCIDDSIFKDDNPMEVK